MTKNALEQMTGGWFVGNFLPSALKTQNCEVAVKQYQKGDCEKSHYHKIATEVTLVLSGSVRMIDQEWSNGAIIVMEPGKSTDFEALADTVCVVVKVPSVENDKYFDL